MNKSIFFDAVRDSVFGGSLAQSQVEGIEAILSSAERNRMTDPHHVANVLANVKRETGGYMLPIKETVYASHRDKNPSDAIVIRRLNAAWAKGQLSWVKTPYWRDGAFGRGQIQITHWSNYIRMGTRLGLDLESNPDLALDKDVSSDIAVIGMAEGMFTGKKLSDYRFPAALDAEPTDHPRRIVNGKDGTDAEISANHRAFYAALKAAGFNQKKPPASHQDVGNTKSTSKPWYIILWGAIIKALGNSRNHQMMRSADRRFAIDFDNRVIEIRSLWS